jgi:hypothetical protein
MIGVNFISAISFSIVMPSLWPYMETVRFLTSPLFQPSSVPCYFFNDWEMRRHRYLIGHGSYFQMAITLYSPGAPLTLFHVIDGHPAADLCRIWYRGKQPFVASRCNTHADLIFH